MTILYVILAAVVLLFICSFLRFALTGPELLTCCAVTRASVRERTPCSPPI